MASTTIAEFQAGRPVEGVFVVQQKSRRLSRNGDPYLALQLTDSTGTIDARVWENAEYFDRTVKLGDTVRAIGKASQYRDAVQLDVRRMEPVGGGTSEPMVPTSSRNLDDLAGEIEFLVESLGDGGLREIVGRIWNGEHADALRRAPATASNHHAWLGGLMEHTVSVAAMCQAACERHPYLDEPLLTATALLHDIGRARELEFSEKISVSGDGELVGHVLLGHEMLREAIAGTDAEAQPWWPKLVHAMQSHHASLDRCRTREAVVLNQMNALDARITPQGPAATRP